MTIDSVFQAAPWALCVVPGIPFACLSEPWIHTTQVSHHGEGTKVVAEQANYQVILLAACPSESVAHIITPQGQQS